MDTSLINVDLHPLYICVDIKKKILRLNLPCEVETTGSTAQRSQTTGDLLLSMKKTRSQLVFGKKEKLSTPLLHPPTNTIKNASNLSSRNAILTKPTTELQMWSQDDLPPLEDV